MYHSIEKEKSNYEYAISEQKLINQIKIIKKFFIIVPLHELINKQSINFPRIALTFDDAFDDFFYNAFPILKKNNIPATVFVPTAFIETDKSMIEGKKHCSWQQMKEMMETGLIDFQSHGHCHKHFKNMDIITLKNDIMLSKKIIEENLSNKVDMFAYPGGKFHDWQNDVILKMGYKAVFTSISKTIHRERKVLPRLTITDKCDSINFKMLISGINEI
ncbi:MAG: polysaccharide deacetylase family protein [Spirochaetota bacterium]|nr:polysaccharide deacetylase family protein [Spirochaetota bacterium]